MIRKTTTCIALGAALLSCAGFFLLQYGRRMGEADYVWAMAQSVRIRLIQYRDGHDGQFPDSLNAPDFLELCDDEVRRFVGSADVNYRRPTADMTQDKAVFATRLRGGELFFTRALREVERRPEHE